MFKSLKIIFSPRFFIVSVFILGSMFLIKTSYAFTGYTSYNGLVMYNGAAYVGDFQSGDGSVNCITSPSSCPGITWSNGSLDWNQNSRLFGYQNPCAAGYGLSFLQTSPWGERYQCSPSALPPPTLSLSCSASSDSNGVVNLNKIYWVTNLSATDSSGNKVDTSKATYLWKDKGTGNSEISNVNGSLASNSVTVSLNGSTATAQCTLPPPPPLYVACYGSSGASGTNWTAISRSYDYYGNSITPNYSWSDAKTGTTESTNGSANSVTANYTDVYGQKSAAVSKKCVPPPVACPAGEALISGVCTNPLNYYDSIFTDSNSKSPKGNSTFISKVSEDIQELRDLAVNDDHESSHIIFQFSDGSVKDYFSDGGDTAGEVSSGSQIQEAKDYAKQHNLTVDSVVDIHNHPNPVASDMGPSAIGYPPSTPDLTYVASLSKAFPKATTACLATDAWNVWEYSAPVGSLFYSNAPLLDLAMNFHSPNILKNNDILVALYNVGNADSLRSNPGPVMNTTQATQSYLKAVKLSGAVIKNVSDQYVQH